LLLLALPGLLSLLLTLLREFPHASGVGMDASSEALAVALEEIAKVLDLSPNTVASRYRYGLSKLRETMKRREVKK